MHVVSRAVLGVAALAGVVALGTPAQAYLTSFPTPGKCVSAKIKTEGKAAAAYTGCYSKAASKGLPVDGACLGKASSKLVTAFGKLDVKGGCITTGDGSGRDADTASYASQNNTLVGSAAGKCDGAKQKLVGKYIAGIAGCYAKAAAKAPGTVDNASGGCTDKVKGKLLAGVTKAETGVDCSNTGQGAALVAAADAYLDAQTCLLAPGSGGCVVATPTPTATPTATSTPGAVCGNGTVDPGEDCDASAGVAGSCQNASNTSAAFTCSSCQCACPSTVTFTGDATSPSSILDTGWTGISHRAPIISNGQTTVGLSGCTGSSRPCGTCNVTGPVENPNAGAGQLRTRRCVATPWIGCPNGDVDCGGGAGSCQYFFGAPLPLAAGGVTTCVVNQFNGSVSGTANVETGDASTTALLSAKVYNGLAIDNPCPRCIGDGAFNDGTAGGVCNGGDRNGQACDANGDVPGRPDFGQTSLDCPPAAAAQIATLKVDLSNKTSTVTKTLTANSPGCTGTGYTNDKCLCDTCNNATADPCMSNADCVAVGATICGGKRCLSGANNGLPCTTNANCPGGSCARPGTPTQPSSCVDDTTIPNRDLECADGDADGEGECTVGPTDQNCTVASGHGQRGCTGDVDCGGGLGSCESLQRKCFLTGGGTFQPSGTSDGTDTLVAVGMADTPMNDVSNPTLAAVFCVSPTGLPAVNTVAGLPGPSRISIKGQAVGAP